MTACQTRPQTAHPKDPFKGATVWTIDRVLKRIEEALSALGTTSGGVARRLAAMKCKGERGNARFCPVLSYLLRQAVGNFSLLVLHGGRLEVYANDGWVEEVRMPYAVELFIRRFDRGDFPECAVASSGPGDHFPAIDWKAINDGGAVAPPELVPGV